MSFDFSALYAQYLASDDHKRITLTPDQLILRIICDFNDYYYVCELGYDEPAYFTGGFTWDEADFIRYYTPTPA